MDRDPAARMQETRPLMARWYKTRLSGKTAARRACKVRQGKDCSEIPARLRNMNDDATGSSQIPGGARCKREGYYFFHSE